MVREMAKTGVACLIVSSDLPEVLALVDRLLVMREGRIRGEIAAGAPEFTEEQAMSLAATADGAVA
jgi:ABC-type sugar transport system ATPase subunit